MVSERPWDLAGGGDYAVEFWFLADDVSHASLVGLLPAEAMIQPPQKSLHVHHMLIEVTARQRRSLNKPASVRFMSRWPLEATIGSNLFSEAVYLPRRWHHVVAQKNVGQMELYFDGESSPLMTTMTETPNLSYLLVVGRRSHDASDVNDIRPFIGRINELATYDRHLTREEVRSHFQLATQGILKE